MTNASRALAERSSQNETDIEVLTSLRLSAAASLAAHEAAPDPHPGYLTPAEGNAAYQPLDSDLTAIAALATTAFGRALLTLADAAAFTTLGNLATTTLKGLTPASGGGTTNFLRADLTWAAPAGGSNLDDILALEVLL